MVTVRAETAAQAADSALSTSVAPRASVTSPPFAVARGRSSSLREADGRRPGTPRGAGRSGREKTEAAPEAVIFRKAFRLLAASGVFPTAVADRAPYTVVDEIRDAGVV